MTNFALYTAPETKPNLTQEQVDAEIAKLNAEIEAMIAERKRLAQEIVTKQGLLNAYNYDYNAV